MFVDHDFTRYPIEIKTDPTKKEHDQSMIITLTDKDNTFVVDIRLHYNRNPPAYFIHRCRENTQAFPRRPGAEATIWHITKTEDFRIIIKCNGEEVLNFQLGDDQCDMSHWRYYWSTHFEKMRFHILDKVSESYKDYSVRASR